MLTPSTEQDALLLLWLLKDMIPIRFVCIREKEEREKKSKESMHFYMFASSFFIFSREL